MVTLEGENIRDYLQVCDQDVAQSPLRWGGIGPSGVHSQGAGGAERQLGAVGGIVLPMSCADHCCRCAVAPGMHFLFLSSLFIPPDNQPGWL